eukprot:TRINITY_DN17746_c0_g1_i1.p1 TRINITY_DN17746_c0_g1~~TRINITY_DN17746_c0_g1_i1.p1  ORF type:complete len:492 (+),score=61.70 TRINITY_DN17746_c0_g1_i1:139-1614(+)
MGCGTSAAHVSAVSVTQPTGNAITAESSTNITAKPTTGGAQTSQNAFHISRTTAPGRPPANGNGTTTTAATATTTAPAANGADTGPGSGGVFRFNQFSTLVSENVLEKEITERGLGRARRAAKDYETRDPSCPVVVRDYSLRTLLGHSKPVKLCVLSPDEQKLASACVRDLAILIWDIVTGRPVLCLDGHEDGVLCCSFSFDNRLLVSGSIDNTLILWDASTGKMLHKMYGHQYLVCACGFSRDGSLIVSGSGDNTLIIWSAKTGLPLGQLEGHNKIVSACSFSPCGNYILSSSADRSIIIWDIKTGGRFKHLRGHFDVVLTCCYSPDGTRVASNDKRCLKVWDVATGVAVISIPITPSSLASPVGTDLPLGCQELRFNLCAFSPDGRSVITCSNDRTVAAWDPETGKEVVSFYCKQAVVALSTGPLSIIAFGDEAGNLYLVELNPVIPRAIIRERMEQDNFALQPADSFYGAPATTALAANPSSDVPIAS